jgi:hypothetical protein
MAYLDVDHLLLVQAFQELLADISRPRQFLPAWYIHIDHLVAVRHERVD